MKPVKELLYLAALQKNLIKPLLDFHWKTGKKSTKYLVNAYSRVATKKSLVSSRRQSFRTQCLLRRRSHFRWLRRTARVAGYSAS